MYCLLHFQHFCIFELFLAQQPGSGCCTFLWCCSSMGECLWCECYWVQLSFCSGNTSHCRFAVTFPSFSNVLVSCVFAVTFTFICVFCSVCSYVYVNICCKVCIVICLLSYVYCHVYCCPVYCHVCCCLVSIVLVHQASPASLRLASQK